MAAERISTLSRYHCKSYFAASHGIFWRFSVHLPRARLSYSRGKLPPATAITPPLLPSAHLIVFPDAGFDFLQFNRNIYSVFLHYDRLCHELSKRVWFVVIPFWIWEYGIAQLVHPLSFQSFICGAEVNISVLCASDYPVITRFVFVIMSGMNSKSSVLVGSLFSHARI